MKRTIATLGVVGLGVMGATVAAYAAPPASSDGNSIIICHAKGGSGSYTAVEVSVNGLSGHSGHADDVVPQNNGDTLPGGQNLTPANLALLAQGCAGGGVVPTTPPPPPPTDEPTDEPTVTPTVTPTDEPTDEPTVEPTVTPTDTSTTPAVVTVVVPPATTPAAVTPAPAAVTPVASTPQGAAAASVPAASNTGYNVQTAVGSSPGGVPAWLTILTGLFTAAGAWVLVKSGLRSRGASS
ncbi:hypothetical protein LJR078_002570 [Arthrobacter sp. LjRoot78]|uniref:hypothetical protein n=1 Tax=Arthrobacter sp. LjRoot78 TaxID=3342338 RepID=UPI003ECCAADC